MDQKNSSFMGEGDVAKMISRYLFQDPVFLRADLLPGIRVLCLIPSAGVHTFL